MIFSKYSNTIFYIAVFIILTETQTQCILYNMPNNLKLKKNFYTFLEIDKKVLKYLSHL